MPRKLVTFECKYCNKTFDDYNECEEHEKRILEITVMLR